MQEESTNEVAVDKLVDELTNPETKRVTDLELKIERLKQDNARINRSYRVLQEEHDALLKQLDLIEGVGVPTFAPIKKKNPRGGTEATAVILLSDWHYEEEVNPECVNGLNTYNLEIAADRTTKCFQAGLRLTEIIGRDVKINTILLALLGDFITNDIHAEFRDTNRMLPMEALSAVQDSLAAGISFLLKNSAYDLVIPCHSGNHARTTEETYIGSEYGHSLEYFMYKNLEKFFVGEKRVQFNVVKGYHSYQQVYDTTIRFHHGHWIRYSGGVGGIFIPANKAIAQWNKAKPATLDCFAHFHQLKDGGNFISNGSVIGYNPFAINIKADYEPPRQAFFVIDSKRGKTFTCPIRVEG